VTATVYIFVYIYMLNVSYCAIFIQLFLIIIAFLIVTAIK